MCTGAVELAAVGVALSAFNIVTKISNSPLLAVTTSLVATAQGVDGAVAGLPLQTDTFAVHTCSAPITQTHTDSIFNLIR